MKNWFRNFMTGRNGPDDLARMLSFVGCFVLLISLFFNGSIVQTLLWVAAVACLIYSYFRVFSRNIYKRQSENQNYVQWRYARMEQFRQQKERRRQKKDYRFYRCAQCNTMTRIPKGHGKIQITCPKCGYTFIRKS